LPDFLSLEDLPFIPHEKTVLIVTGSQGESRAALARIARGDHDVRLTLGDTVIFSARAIPGNETEINVVKNKLVAAGVKVIDPDNTKHTIHVSGHPRRDEVIDMLQWLKPKTVVPVHGERVMLEAHAALARELQVSHTLVPVNGSVIRLGPEAPDYVDHLETGLLAVEPGRIMVADHQALIDRRKLQYTGSVHVSLVLDAQGNMLGTPQVTTTGLIDPQDEEEAEFEDTVIDEINEILKDISYDDRLEDHQIAEDVRIGVRRFVHHFLGLKPKTSVHVLRV
jgi:ribonuclease J